MAVKRAVVKISGAVQGVGFRPFIYKLAREYGLKGFVLNDCVGVRIEVEGEENDILEFILSIDSRKPAISHIFSLEVEFKDEIKGYTEFRIESSINQERREVFILPDISVCDRCLEEMLEPSDRRYLYPFVNCTNCGPRFSIVESLPYDRINTTMKKFSMCPECEAEYNDPSNRRFHAQPNACPTCGPQIYLYTPEGELIDTSITALHKSCKFIMDGYILAVKGIGGFHLVCDGTNTNSVSILRDRKKRLEKPFAVMFKDIQQIEKYADITPYERVLITSPQRPIVLVKKRDECSLSPEVAPGIDKLGVFLPYSPLHYLILREVDRPLVMTSANLSDEPIVKDNTEAFQKLSKFADYILLHDRDIQNRVDDSVAFCVGDKTVFVRKARGYSPSYIKLPALLDKKVLAVGGQQKVAIAIAFEDKVIMSQHIGDMNTLPSIESFQETVFSFFKLYNFFPDVVVSDLHPGYYTTKWAEEFSKSTKVEHIKLQHHIAHALSLALDSQVDGDVLYICWDGTGYGIDGNIWGGEFINLEDLDSPRVLNFRYFRLITGEKAIKEPRRVALSILFEMYGKDVSKLPIPTVESFQEKEIESLHKLWERGVNSPLTSSVGRLFDGVSSILGIKQKLSYEGQSGMMMERFYNPEVKDFYPYSVKGREIDWSEIFEGILKDRYDISLAVSRFINTLSKIVIDASKSMGLKVGLSGGVFQNRALLGKIISDCKEEGIGVYIHSKVPPNDGGIALGQVGAILKMVK